jgi:hypothetical protein
MKHALVLALLALLILLPVEAAPVKVAILGGNPRLVEVIDLITVELSAHPDVSLLERAEMKKIAGEQALSAAQQTNYLALGRLLGADGLVILTTLRPTYAPENELVAVQWIAVKPGAVLDSRLEPLPATNRMEWSKEVAQRAISLLPKMALLQKEAIGISILNLRESLTGRARRDRVLTTMLQTRLARETNLLVMERRNLDRLQTEKLWSQEESTFWNGAYTLEGTIDPDGAAANSVGLELRLNSAGKKPLIVRASKPLREEAALISDLGKQVSEALGLGLRPELDPAQEAAAYLAEAKWALRWRMIGEAQSAANAAWALGNRSLESSATRIRSYSQRIAYSTYWTAISPREFTVAGTKVSLDRSVPSGAVDEDQLSFTSTAVQIASEDLATFTRAQVKPSGDWLEAAAGALDRACEVLELSLLSPLSRNKYPAELLLLRKSSRELSAGLLPFSSPGFQAAGLAVRGLGLWHERAEEAREEFRQLIRRPDFPSSRSALIRRHYFSFGRSDALFTDWSDPDGRRGADMGMSFVAELGASAEMELQVEAALLKLADDNWLGEIDQLLPRTRELLHQRAPQLFTAGRLKSDWEYFTRAVMFRLEGLPYPLQTQLRGAFLPSFETEFKDFLSQVKLSKAEDYLRTLVESASFKPFDLMVYQRETGTEQRTMEDASRHNALLDQYLAKFGPWMKDAPNPARGAMIISSNQAGMARRMNLVRTNPPKPPPSMQKPVEKISSTNALLRIARMTLPPATNRFSSTQDLRPQAFQIQGNFLWATVTWETVWQYDALVAAAEKGDQEAKARVDEMVRRQNGEVPKDCDCEFLANNPRQLALLRFDLGTGKETRFEVPEQTGASGAGPGREPFRNFGITEQNAVVLAGDRIRILDFASGKWTRSTHTVSLPASMFLLAGRVIIQNADSILEFEPASDTLIILASSRRTPARTVLDSIDLSGAQLWASPGGKVFVNAARQIFGLEGADWKKIGDVPANFMPWAGGSSLLATFRDDVTGHRLYRLKADQAVTRELLLRDRPGPGSMPRPGPGPGPQESPQFDLAVGATILPNINRAVRNVPPVLSDGEDLWILSGRGAHSDRCHFTGK